MTTPHLTLVSQPQPARTRRDMVAFLSSHSADVIIASYARYAQNAASVADDWRAVFDAMDAEARKVLEQRTADSGQRTGKPASTELSAVNRQLSTDDAVADAWRSYGHFAATLDPLGLAQPKGHAELQPHALQSVYGGTTGYEYMHLTNTEQRQWWQQRIEGGQAALTVDDQRKILNDITKAEGLEEFLSRKFVGVKRFGLEGSESCMAAIEQIIYRGAELGVNEFCFGMAHRGRINVLTNTCGKNMTKLFAEFQGAAPNPAGVPGSSDVKYHMGYSNDRDIAGKKVHVTLSPNPSHLEFVNAVAEGKVRAKQFQRSGKKLPYAASAFTEVCPVLLHGDAAFAGQGIVAEVLMMSELRGYKTGGTVHIITNNQIGFTTNMEDARSTPYASDMAKMINVPVLHVNGDDAEAVARAARLCIEWRQQFGRDVVLDVIGYRRNGHNETLEPTFTQPVMYSVIRNHKTTRAIYADKLAASGAVPAAESSKMVEDFTATMEEALKATSTYTANKADWLEGAWTGLKHAENADVSTTTSVPVETLKDLGGKLSTPPAGFEVNSKIIRQLQARAEMMNSGEGIDWGTGELLAYATLLTEGFPVRLSGEDVETGTFSHRHAVLNDQKTGAKITPLNGLKNGQAPIEIVNSLLSEAGVLGFEYGFSAAEPNTLTIWEAQFGDFANGAQVLIDQFIASAEAKWLRMCGLVMLLPHGYEGQGPEHSSARLERFLQLCAEDNMQVCNLTTPANLFHAFRRQLHRSFRKPLVIMSPKSLLRHKMAVSSLKDFGPGTSFKPVIGETSTTLKPAKDIRRVVMCSGKVYYDLVQARDEKKIDDVAVIRMEQFYPFPHLALKEQLAQYPKAEMVWCQEEPENQGAWSFVDRRIEKVLAELQHKSARPRYVGRPAAAAPACGQTSRHNEEQAKLLGEALA